MTRRTHAALRQRRAHRRADRRRPAEAREAGRPKSRSAQPQRRRARGDDVPRGGRGRGAKLDLDALDALPSASGGAEWQCLAQAIYFESRGEPLDGQIAVAEVVLNRARTATFHVRSAASPTRAASSPTSATATPTRCGAASPSARSEKLASLMLAGRERALTDGALYFHSRVGAARLVAALRAARRRSATTCSTGRRPASPAAEGSLSEAFEAALRESPPAGAAVVSRGCLRDGGGRIVGRCPPRPRHDSGSVRALPGAVQPRRLRARRRGADAGQGRARGAVGTRRRRRAMALRRSRRGGDADGRRARGARGRARRPGAAPHRQQLATSRWSSSLRTRSARCRCRLRRC